MLNQMKSKISKAARRIRRTHHGEEHAPSNPVIIELASDLDPSFIPHYVPPMPPYDPTIIESPPALDLSPVLRPSKKRRLPTFALLDISGSLTPDIKDAASEASCLCERCQRIDFARLRDLPDGAIVRRLDKISSSCTACAFFQAWYRRDATAQSSELRSRVTISDRYFQNRLGINSVFLQLSSSYSNFGRAVLISDSMPSELAGRLVEGIGVNYKLFKHWLDYCDTNHSIECSPKQAPPAGLSVIDCITAKILPYSLEDGSASYVTLSYVWGISTIESSSQDFMSLTTAPKVIHDAMLVVVQLGFRYLWVDRYCIPQDDATLKDSQIRDMGRIYAASALTIIAAAGEGPDYGLVGVSSRPRAEQLQATVGNTTLIRQCEHPGILVQGSKWNTRGWTYQEGLLARRRLVFTEEEAYFQCQSMDCLESISAPMGIYHNSITSHNVVFLRPVFPIAVSYESPIELLKRISEYFVRDLSFDSDALEAISGVFELFRLTKKPVSALCGLPILNPASVYPSQKTPETIRMCLLVLALCWRSDGKLCRRSSFPSWTWAGWKPGSKGAKIDFEVLNMLERRDGISIPGIFSLPPNMVITIQNGDGLPLDWERDFETILYRYAIEDYLGSLQVTGWTFSFSFQVGEHWVTKPDLPFASQSLLSVLGDALQPEHLSLQGKKEIEVTALLLFQSKYKGDATSYRLSGGKGTVFPRNCTAGLLFLIRTHQSTFERLSYYTATNLPDLLDVSYQRFAKGLGIDIKYQQVCII